MTPRRNQPTCRRDEHEIRGYTRWEAHSIGSVVHNLGPSDTRHVAGHLRGNGGAVVAVRFACGSTHPALSGCLSRRTSPRASLHDLHGLHRFHRLHGRGRRRRRSPSRSPLSGGRSGDLQNHGRRRRRPSLPLDPRSCCCRVRGRGRRTGRAERRHAQGRAHAGHEQRLGHGDCPPRFGSSSSCGCRCGGWSTSSSSRRRPCRWRRPTRNNGGPHGHAVYAPQWHGRCASARRLCRGCLRAAKPKAHAHGRRRSLAALPPRTGMSAHSSSPRARASSAPSPGASRRRGASPAAGSARTRHATRRRHCLPGRHGAWRGRGKGA